MSETPTPPPPHRRRQRLAQFAQYLVLGALVGWVAQEWRVIKIGPWLMPSVALACSLVGLTRWRWSVWALAGAHAAALLVIGWTPLPVALITGLSRTDSPGDAPAVVILGTGGAMLQERTTRALEWAAGHPGSVIVITRVPGDGPYWDTWITEQARTLGLHHEVAIAGPVVNTHDEAVAVAALAKSRGWSHVALVTHAWHMPRAAAAFERAGVQVICVPCRDGRLTGGVDRYTDVRVSLFGHWFSEVVGTWVYRCRGWI